MREKSAIRRVLPILVAAVLLTAIFVDVVAAGVKAVSGKSRAATSLLRWSLAVERETLAQ